MNWTVQYSGVFENNEPVILKATSHDVDAWSWYLQQCIEKFIKEIRRYSVNEYDNPTWE